MARERKPLNRNRKFLKQGKIFVLAYEGNNTEPQYYEALKEKLRYKNIVVDIESLKRPKGDTKSAPKYVFQQLKEKKQEFQFRDKDEFWMIIDRDAWELDEWIEKCKEEGNFYVALSNPCFEFWLLLHLFEIENFSKEEKELLFRNEKVSTNKRYIEKYLTDSLEGGYNKNKIQAQRFLEDKTLQFAIAQAEKLKENDLQIALGSDNYKLVKKLLEY